MKPFVKGLIIGGMLVAVVFLLLLNSSVPLLFNATFSSLRSGNVPQDSVKITQEYLYARLQEISPALEDYLETKDTQHLASAQQSLAKLSSVCVAYGDHFPYLRDDETGMNTINAAWCVRFFICVHDEISEMLSREVTPEDRQTLAALSGIFSPLAEDTTVTFTSVFFNFNTSSLFNHRGFNNLIVYDSDQHLVPATF